MAGVVALLLPAAGGCFAGFLSCVEAPPLSEEAQQDPVVRIPAQRREQGGALNGP